MEDHSAYNYETFEQACEDQARRAAAEAAAAKLRTQLAEGHARRTQPHAAPERLTAKLERNLDRDVANILWLEGDAQAAIDRILER